MGGKVKRKAGLAAVATLAEHTAAAAAAVPACALCGRPLGARVEWHHLIPKSEGGRDTAAIHPICHRTIHATIANAELARRCSNPDSLRARAELQPFLRWIADKPPDFTHRCAARASGWGASLAGALFLRRRAALLAQLRLRGGILAEILSRSRGSDGPS